MEHFADETVIGILSLASLAHGVTQAHAGRLMDQLNRMHAEFPAVVPEIPSRDLWMKFLYGDLVKTGNDIFFTLGKDQWTMELTVERSLRNLLVIQQRRGEACVRALVPAAHMFSQLMAASSR